MRLSRLTAVAAVLSFLPPLSARAPAQQPIRVVRHAPADTARAGDVITVTFDRPVAGSPERSANPERFVRIEPPLAAAVQWRDPVTLRVIPAEPLASGRRYQFTIDTTFTAIDGGRLAAPYRFGLNTQGPRLLGSAPGLNAQSPTALDPTGRLTLTYSAPVDSARLSSVARLEISANGTCAGQVIRYVAGAQREMSDQDDYSTRRVGMSGDDADGRFRRIVVLSPNTRPPEGCVGALVLPSFDPYDRAEIQYRAATASPFRLAAVHCTTDDCAMAPALLVAFTAGVRRDVLLDRLRIDPAVPFTIDESDAPSTQWTIRFPARPRTTYHVRVDSTLIDVHGRRITGALEASVAIRDRRAALGHQLGSFTLSRQHPVLRLTHVNIDSAEVVIIPIPDELRTRIFVQRVPPDSIARTIARLRDTVRFTVTLPGALNEERITEIPIPRSVLTRFPGSMLAIRARAVGVSRLLGELPRENPATARTRVLPRVQIVADPADPLSQNAAIVQITNLMAHAKVAEGWGAVFVTDVNDGRPVEGARVIIRDLLDSAIASGVTDAAGVANLRASPTWKPFMRAAPENDWWGQGGWIAIRGRLVEVTKGTDRSLTSLSDQYYGGWPPYWSRVDRSYNRARFVRAMVHTERAIYRPGEKVYVGSIVREGWLGDLRVPSAGDSVRLRVAAKSMYGPESEIIRDTVLRLSGFGMAADSFALRRGATLCDYTVRLDAMSPDGWRSAAWGSFRVAEYRAAQFRASLTLDSATRFLGDTIGARVNAGYYFGVPMAGAIVRWSAATTELRDRLAIPGLPAGFAVGTRYSGGPERLPNGSVSGVDTLDAAGVATLSIPTVRGTLTGPGQVDVQISVEDLDRQAVVAERSAVAHASEFYIAVRDSGRSWYWKQGEPKTLQVLAVRPDGRRVSGARVGVIVIRHHAMYAQRGDAVSPTPRWVSDTIARDSLVTSDSIVSYRLTPGRDGSHEVVFETRDAHERAVTTSVGAYVISPRWIGSWGWGSDPLSLAMRLARDTVAPGDSVTISLLSPFSRAEAWVTIEREGILAQRRMTIGQGEATFRIPVTERFVPGATVSVVLVDASPAWQADSLHRRIRRGQATLTVDRSAKELAVVIAPGAARYAPGDTARITVRLRDHRGRPAAGQVTLWAVDEGVLALTDSAHLSPLDSIYAPRGSGLTFATTAGTLASLDRMLTPPGWRVSLRSVLGSSATMLAAVVKTGTATAVVDAGVLPRSDFRTTAFYHAALVTDSSGIVVVATRLPDNLTTYRLVAIAVSADDRYGSAESSLLVTKPLLVRSALPRFVRTGDELVAGAVVTNQTAESVPVRVRASGTSVTLNATGDVERTLERGASTEVRFGWRASAAPGDTAAFRFDIRGGANTDAVLTSLPVRAPYSPRYHAYAGVARGSETVRMMLPRGIDPARSRLTIRVGNTPAPAIRAAYDRMNVYPYFCTEQLTSAGRVIVAMLRLQRARLVDSTVAPGPSVLRGRLQFVVDELSRRQAADGGIGYWSNAGWTTPAISAYAGTLLLDARDMGLSVLPHVIDGIAEYVKAGSDSAYDENQWGTDTVFGARADRERRVAARLSSGLAALVYLRRAGLPDVDQEDRVLRAERRMVWEDRVWLAELLAGRDDRSAARAVLARVWRDVEVAGARLDLPDSLLHTYWFQSHVRPMARLLKATMAIEPNHPRLGLLVERVVQQGRADRGWVWNTQDYASSADALIQVAMWQREVTRTPVTVRSAIGRGRNRVLASKLPGEGVDSAIALAGLLERDGDWMVLPLRIEAGKGAVFYTLTVEEVPLEPPTTPDAKGIVIERWYERFDDARPATEVKAGELVRGRLRITVPSDREFVAVEALLPAGLEVVDLSLRTSRTLGPFESTASEAAEREGDRANRGESLGTLYGSWYGGWWSPWEHLEYRDDRVLYFARSLWKGTYTATYVARATTAGTFVHPPAHAEEMYNQSLGGRSDGGTFRIMP